MLVHVIPLHCPHVSEQWRYIFPTAAGVPFMFAYAVASDYFQLWFGGSYMYLIHSMWLQCLGNLIPTWLHPRCFLTRPAIGDVHASCGIGQHLKFVAGIQKEYSSSQQQPFGWIVLPAQVLDIGRLPLPLLQVSFEQSCMRTWQYHNQHLLMNVRCWHHPPVPSWIREVWWSSS